MGTTTIEITEEQKQQLDELKIIKSEPYKSVLKRLLEDPATDASTQELVEELKNEISMANEPGVEVDIESLNERVEKLTTMVEQTRDNTEEVKNWMRQ